MIFIIFGTLTASLAISYAWWTKVRVICLRQEVFDLRDGLFDLARRLELLDDPAHRAARRHLNAVANTIGDITFEMLLFLQDRQVPVRTPIPESTNVQLKGAIEDTLQRCADKLAYSLLYETFSGWVLLMRFKIRGIVSRSRPSFKMSCYDWLVSPKPEHLVQVHTLARGDAVLAGC